MRALVLSLVFLLACGSSHTPSTTIPAHSSYGIPSSPLSILPCESGNRIGYWLDDCSTKWCLPGDNINLFYSINMDVYMAYDTNPNLQYGATQEVNNTTCGANTNPWRVYKLINNYIDPIQIDPVNLCLGSICSKIVTQHWAQSNTTYTLYFLEEIFSTSVHN